MNGYEDLDKTTNKIFISYSRKDSLDVAEFRSTLKYRNFEILIDDEEITFNKPWKANIKKKIIDSKGAILFLSGNALNPESPIRTLEVPLIAKRFSDPDDDFYFFPVLLEDIDKELFENYNFTPLGSQEPVNFLEYFQLYDLKSNLTLKNLSLRKRKREYQILNADISNALEGGTKSPGRKRIKRARQRKSLLSGLALAFLLFGSLVFTNTEAFAQIRYQVLKIAYDTFRAENPTQDNSTFANAIASQISEIDDLESLGADDVFIQELAEVEEINLQLESEQNSSFFNSLLGNEDTTTTSTTTTVAPVLTTTTTSISGQTTTTTTPVTTTTLVSSSADTTAPTFTQALTASNITTNTVDLNWSASDNVGVSYYVLKEGSSEIYRGSGTTKEIEGILSGNNYTLTVYAYDAAGNSNTSSVSFTTLGSSTSTTTTSTTSTSTTTTTVPASYGTPTIYKVTVSGSTITAYYNDATTNSGLSIVGHGCQYSTVSGGPSGGTSTQSYSSSCSLDFPAEYTTVSIQVKQSFEGQVSCGDGCYTDNWTDWTSPVTVYLTGDGSISDSNIQFVWDIPDLGPGCYPDTYPKNKQVNSALLPFTEAEVRQSLLDYGNSYGRLCGDDLVNAYVNHWKAKTADNIKALYPSWSDSVLNTYLNGNGSGGWYVEWNSTQLTPPWSPPADSDESIINGTYENICTSQGWTECARWKVYDELGNDTGGGGIGPYPLSAFQNLVNCVSGGVNVCGGSPTGHAVVTGRYYPDESEAESFSYSFSLRCDGGPDGYNVGPKVTTVGGSAVVEWYNYNANGGYSSPQGSFYVDADSTSSRAIYWGNGIDSGGNWNVLTIYYRVGQTLSEAQSQNYSSSVTVDLSQGCP
jgi:hypothetical protein